MSRLMPLVALVLAALWLPATLHCQLEDLGLGALFACADQATDPAGSNGGDCPDQACQTVESGQLAFVKSRVAAALPPVLACARATGFPQATPTAPAPETFAFRHDATPPRQRPWQFLRRAAPPARAPALHS